MISINTLKDALLQLFFPHICNGCGTDMLGRDSLLCMRCLDALPATGFEIHPGNPAEKLFYGRLLLRAASAQYYFTKESLMQKLMHQFKYKANRDLGFQLGRQMGTQLLSSGRFAADALVPLPLFASKEKRRGYNQAAVLCEGMASVMKLPVWDKVIIRPQHTDTQTKKGRIERWQNMEGKFRISNPEQVRGKHILLVDDVVTTGATLEACGQEILDLGDTALSIATLCIASRI